MSRFAELLKRSETVTAQSIAANSQKQYDSCLNVYKTTMQDHLQTAPLPITEEKLKVFLLFKQGEGRNYSTLNNYVNAVAHYLASNHLPNLTLSFEFKRFKKGLRRQMMGDKHPFQKEPFQFEWFDELAEIMDLKTYDDRLFFFLMTLAFHFFMRVSEVLSLRPCDVILDEAKNLLSVNFWKTKTDQFGSGTVSFINLHDDICCPGKYVDVLTRLPQDEPILTLSSKAMTSKLRFLLKKISVSDSDRYSWHSFRRGAAYRASQMGIQDCVIKKHGRWQSDAYMRYCRVDAVRAGGEIADAFRR